jgi:hypothetical protein
MKPLGLVRAVAGEAARFCGEHCRVEFAGLVDAGGVILPSYHDGHERIDLQVASRRLGFCASCGADLRPPLPEQRGTRSVVDGRVLRPLPSGELPRPCRLGSQSWRPDVAACGGCNAPRAQRLTRCVRRPGPGP